ncbi:MAG: hypothetical protein ABIQ75_08650 [Flavobacteriales bacterium]
MLRLFLVVVLIVHGMIHFTGMMRTILPPHIPTFKTYIDKPLGIEWALAGLLFIVSGVLLGVGQERWYIAAAIALVFSQVLIFFNWHDARFGTVANVILAIAVYFGAAIWDFHVRYDPAVDRTGEHAQTLPGQRISEQDPAALPQSFFPAVGAARHRPSGLFVFGRSTLLS